MRSDTGKLLKAKALARCQYSQGVAWKLWGPGVGRVRLEEEEGLKQSQTTLIWTFQQEMCSTTQDVILYEVVSSNMGESKRKFGAGYPTFQEYSSLPQGFSNLHVGTNYLVILLKCRFWFSRSGVGLNILCFSQALWWCSPSRDLIPDSQALLQFEKKSRWDRRIWLGKARELPRQISMEWKDFDTVVIYILILSFVNFETWLVV